MKKHITVVIYFSLFIVIGGCAHNGDTKNVCVNSESQPYTACHYVDGECLSWSTTCVNDGGRRICTKECQDREQREVCGTEFRDVCKEYELRYYCEAQKQWVTDIDFNNNCSMTLVKKAAKKAKKAKKAAKKEEAPPSGDPNIATADASTPSGGTTEQLEVSGDAGTQRSQSHDTKKPEKKAKKIKKAKKPKKPVEKEEAPSGGPASEDVT
ncbi:hypothetical protein LPW11_05835 [Geomonas sp. RF6]|uniref:hypothetical protein n=1 Tax=Geomonas sp. RF6 TaxID=2897342 RepID=UPI001E59176D|nr:hypothetical protein [Geomonas sp. RF6]UFS71711.1 hypothetical protein LPW11_05835 [Geomonas sp. RF6]